MIEELFERAYPMARRAAGVRLANAVVRGTVAPNERPDVEQELLLAVWRAMPKFDSARASLRTYVEMVVATRFISLMRSRRRRPMLQLLDFAEPATLDGIPAIEFSTDFQRVLSGVSESDRRIAQSLRHQTATETSRSVGVSRAKVYRAIARLRLAFGAAGFGADRGIRRQESCP